MSSGIKVCSRIILVPLLFFIRRRGRIRWGLCWLGYNNLPLLRALFTNRTRRVDRARPSHSELPRATAIDFSLEYCHHWHPRPRHRANPPRIRSRGDSEFSQVFGRHRHRRHPANFIPLTCREASASCFVRVFRQFRPLVGRRTRYPVV